MLQSNKIEDEYVKKLEQQIRNYVYRHFVSTEGDTTDDVRQEMFEIVWKSYMNCNGLSKIVKKQRLIPRWQLDLLFLNALRNLKLIESNTETFHHPNPAKVLIDENGEIIDFYYPSIPDPLEEQEEAEERKSKVPTGKEKKRWLERIRRLKELGYSDQEIVEMLKPAKQEVLF